MSMKKKELPNVYEAECALLGSMILDWRVCGSVIQIVKSGDFFYSRKNAAIFDAIISVYDAHGVLDIVQVKHELEKGDTLNLVGGIDYLIALGESVPSSTSAEYYARLVADSHGKRQIIDACEKTIMDVYESGEDLKTLLNGAEGKLFSVAEDGSSQPDRIGKLLEESYEGMSGKNRGCLTGYNNLNDMTYGFQPGDMVIIAARPSMGKTALGLNIAYHMAAIERYPVLFFSLEMGRDQVAKRVMSFAGGVDSHRINRKCLTQVEVEQIKEAVDCAAASPMYVDCPPVASLLDLRSRSRRMHEKYGIKAIFIDYLQLVTGPKSDSRQAEVSAVSRGLKSIARELNVPVICMCQLNRASESRTEHIPRMSDLRESGAIEQDADIVMLLHREDYYKVNQSDRDGKADLIVSKHRNGPTGKLDLFWNPGHTRFNEYLEI